MTGKKQDKKYCSTMKELEYLIPKSIKFTSAADDLHSQCNSFIENIFQKGRSPLTIKEYARTVAHFLEFLKDYLGHNVKLKDIKHLDKITLNSYLSYYKKPIKNQLTANLKEKFLNDKYSFLSKKPKKILEQDRKFFEKKETQILLDDLDKIFTGQIKSGLELNNKLKNYKNLDHKIERLRRNSCIKLHNVSYEKSARSVARCTSVLRTFISFLIKNNKWESHSIRKIESSKFKQRTDNKVFEESEIINFLDYLDPDKQELSHDHKFNNWQHKRDLSIFYFLYSSGLRISELLQFKINDFPLKEFTKIKGKGDKERFIVVLNIVNEKIKNYLESCSNSINGFNLSNDDPLFVKSIKGQKKKLSARDIQRTMKSHIEKFEGNYPTFSTPHSLRHSFASHILRGGADIRTIQELLGHSSLSSTQIYTKLDEKSLLDIYDKSHPHSKDKI